MQSHCVSIGSGEFMWKIGQSSLKLRGSNYYCNSAEVCFWPVSVSYRYCQLLLKDRQKDYSIADDIERIMLYRL